MPSSNFDDARKFFTWLKPPFLAVYTIEPDGRLKFRSDGNVPLQQLLDEHKNTYFSLAVPIGGLKKKALKSELVSTRFLHVDLDPIDGQDPIKEQNRLLDSVTETRPADVPPPSCIIASGRGIQALWRLKEPVELPGGIYNIESANLWLIDRLNAPPGTHNVDRILRVPGSWNALDPKKVAKGYQPRLAQLVEVNDNAYTLDDFGKWVEPELQTGSSTYAASADDITDVPVKVTGLSRYDKIKLPLRVKWLIAHGTPSAHLEDYERDFGSIGNRNPSDRSAWLYDVCCQLLRYGVDRGEILGILTDKAWGISGHCLDQKDPDRAARRQLARALRTVEKDPPKEPAPDPKADKSSSSEDSEEDDLRGPSQKAVDEINSIYFAILNGGKLQYYREEGQKVVSLDKPAIEFELGDKFVTSVDAKGKVTLTPAFKVWKTHPDRRYYKDGFILEPGVESDTKYNLWKGFGIDPAKGDWELLRYHIFHVLSKGNEILANYIINWTAWAFQNPGSPPGTALVFRGTEGTGKGVFCNALVTAFGDTHAMRIQSMKHLVGQFNAHLRHCCLLFCDEAITPGSDGEGALKGLVTEPNIPIEAKGVDLVNMPNHLHICLASNEDYVVPSGPDARRWVVCDVSAERMGDVLYFDKLRTHIKDGGLAAMMYDMLDMDLTDFVPFRDAPKTDGLSEQKALSLKGFDRFWFDCLRAGEAPFHKFTDRDLKMPFVATSTLRNIAAERQRCEISLTSVGRLLGELGYTKDELHRPRGYILPDLKEARRLWNEKKFPIQWDGTSSWAAIDLLGEKGKRTHEPETEGQLF